MTDCKSLVQVWLSMCVEYLLCNNASLSSNILGLPIFWRNSIGQLPLKEPNVATVFVKILLIFLFYFFYIGKYYYQKLVSSSLKMPSVSLPLKFQDWLIFIMKHIAKKKSLLPTNIWLGVISEKGSNWPLFFDQINSVQAFISYFWPFIWLLF